MSDALRTIREIADEILPYTEEQNPNEFWTRMWGKLRGAANDIERDLQSAQSKLATMTAECNTLQVNDDELRRSYAILAVERNLVQSRLARYEQAAKEIPEYLLSTQSLADKLYSIGWHSPNDAQWEKIGKLGDTLRDALTECKIELATAAKLRVALEKVCDDRFNEIAKLHDELAAARAEAIEECEMACQRAAVEAGVSSMAFALRYIFIDAIRAIDALEQNVAEPASPSVAVSDSPQGADALVSAAPDRRQGQRRDRPKNQRMLPDRRKPK